MATKKNTVRRDVAYLRIGLEEYLLDTDKAMQAIKLFREAFKCRRYYVGNGNGFRYVAEGPPELEMTVVDPRHVDIPNGAPVLEDRRR
jgi:hypothetical protein